MRHVHLVGSLPFRSDEEAMRKAFEALGAHAVTLPDGEVGTPTRAYPKGDRVGWISAQVQRCADNDDFRVLRDIVREGERGLQADYTKGYLLEPRLPPRKLAERLNLGYLEFFERNYGTFRRLRRKYGREELRFQVGVPTGLDITFTSMKPLTALRYAGAFNRAIAREVNTIMNAAGDDVVVQIEVPIELGLATRLPPALTGLAARSVTSLVSRLDPATEIGVHVCVGDLNNKSLVPLETLRHLVRFANRMVARWPRTHRLSYLHFPLAEGDRPPHLDREFYRVLGGLRLPASVRPIAGFVHEKLSEEEHRVILRAVEEALGRPVDVASACGLGRRTAGTAERLLAMSVKVAEA